MERKSVKHDRMGYKIMLAIIVIGLVLLSGCVLPLEKAPQDKPEKQEAPVKSERLNAKDKAELLDAVEKMKRENTKIADTINTIALAAKQKEDPFLEDRINDLNKIHTGNTIAVLLGKVEDGVKNEDESLLEFSQRLHLEVDAAVILAGDLVDYARNRTRSRDDALLSNATLLEKQEREFNRVCDVEYVKKIESLMGVKFDDKKDEEIKVELAATYGFDKNKMDILAGIEGLEFDSVQTNVNVQSNVTENATKPFLSEKSTKEKEKILSMMSTRPMLLLAEANGITTIDGKNIALSSGGGQSKNISSPASLTPLANRPVGADLFLHENEPSIAAKPDDTNIVVAASHAIPNKECKAFRSSDGGATWLSTNLPLKQPGDFCSDPVVRWSPDGRKVYAAYISIRGFSFFFSTSDIVVSVSSNNGATWSPPVVAIPGIPGEFFPDKPWLDVHTAFTGPDVDRKVYVTASRFSTVGIEIVFTRSLNEASTFEPIQILAASSGFDETIQGSRPIGGKPTDRETGDVLVCWYNSDTDVVFAFRFAGNFSIRCRSSTDYGVNFGPEIKAMDTSTFGNFEVPRFLGPNFKFHRWFGSMFPSITITGDGAAHMVFTADPVANISSGEDGDIYYIKSSGPLYNVWTSPLCLNDDGTERAQGFATITAKPVAGGYALVAAWEDHRNSPSKPIPGISCGFGGPGIDNGTNCIYDIYTNTSSDGFSWSSSNTKLSDKSSMSDSSFIGDYIDSSTNKVLTDKSAHIIWTDRRDKVSIFQFEDDVFTDLGNVP